MGSILRTLWNDFMGYEEKSRPIDYRHTSADLVSRSEWGAVPPLSVEEFDEMVLPLSVAYVRPTGTRKCKMRSSCIRAMKEIQKRDMDNGMPDIQHNFYIGGDGHIYEGRGWSYARTEIDDDDLVSNSSLSIGVIGDWQVPHRMPPRRMVEAAVHVINLGMRRGVLRDDCLLQSLNARFTV